LKLWLQQQSSSSATRLCPHRTAHHIHKQAEPELIPLDIVYEDDSLIVVNKVN